MVQSVSTWGWSMPVDEHRTKLHFKTLVIILCKQEKKRVEPTYREEILLKSRLKCIVAATLKISQSFTPVSAQQEFYSKVKEKRKRFPSNESLQVISLLQDGIKLQGKVLFLTLWFSRMLDENENVCLTEAEGNFEWVYIDWEFNFLRSKWVFRFVDKSESSENVVIFKYGKRILYAVNVTNKTCYGV